MKVSIDLSIHLVGSNPPRPEWFAQLVRDAMHEYLESPRIVEGERISKEAGILTDADISMRRTVATQIAMQLPRVEVTPDLGESKIASMTAK